MRQPAVHRPEIEVPMPDPMMLVRIELDEMEEPPLLRLFIKQEP